MLDDSGRLAALRRTGLLDSPREPAFDRLTSLAARLAAAPIALVALVEPHRQFFKSSFRVSSDLLPERETPISHCICQHTVVGREPLVIGDARTDPLVRDNGAVRELGVAAYLGVPIITGEGHALGAICVMDTAPREWSRDDVSLLEDLAACAVTEIELRASNAAAAKRLEALAESEARYRFIFEDGPLPIFAYDIESRHIVAANHMMTVLYGWSYEELLGLSVMELIASEDRERMENRMGLPVPGVRRWVDVRHQTRDGRPLDVEAHGHDVTIDGRRCRLAAVADMTEQRKGRAALERLAAVVNASDDAIFTTTVDGTITSWNPGAQRLFGHAPEEAIGASFLLLVPADAREEAVAVLETTCGGARVSHREVERVTRDGRRRMISCSTVPMLEHDAVTGVSVTMRDVTQRLDLEAQLRHAQKMDAVGRLAGGIAHDFNNLLGVVSSAGDFLRRGLPPESPLRADADDIVAVAERGAALTRQLLSFSRRQPVEPRVVTLDAIIVAGRRLLERIAREDVSVRAELRAGDARVFADPGQLEQALVNLVVNARDAIASRGVITIRTYRRIIREPHSHRHGVLSPGRYVVLEVQDDGSGMCEEVVSRLFEPFFTTKPQGQGSGLGLATVHGIVEQAGGHVTVDTTLGAGSTFTVYLPLTRDLPKAVDARPEADARAQGTESVLLVEDDPILRRQARRTLADRGYSVFEAGDGAEAMAVAAAHGGTIDLLVTDLVMPGMSGRELIDALRAVYPALLVLVTSGYGPEAPGAARGADASLAKPFTPGALARAVRDILDTAGR